MIRLLMDVFKQTFEMHTTNVMHHYKKVKIKHIFLKKLQRVIFGQKTSMFQLQKDNFFLSVKMFFQRLME